MSKIIDFFMQNARTIGIVYVVGAVVVFVSDDSVLHLGRQSKQKGTGALL